jgi:hypothetical protein
MSRRLASIALACLFGSGCGTQAEEPSATGGAAGTSATGGASVGGSAGTSATGGASTGGSAGSGGASGTTGGSGGDAALVPVFIAQGHQGRTTVSFDDGHTFTHEHSEDDSYPCFVDDQHDCDHSEFAGRGIAYGDGAFVITWGWGHPGTLQRSTDGFTWDTVATETPTFADVAYGKGKFVACGNPTQVSTDGLTWTEGGPLSFDFNYRGIEFVPSGGGTFVVTGESGDQRDISVSSDGVVWHSATTRPDLCGAYLRGVAGNETTLVVASGQGHVCYSTDAGDTWTQKDVADGFSSPILWTGTEFMIWNRSTLWRSADGEEWQSEATTPDVAIGPVARSDQGTFVAANDGWLVWYEEQQFYRSVDGVNWDVLEQGTAFTGSHPIYFFGFGYVQP